jgi:hypothetical protein
MMLHGDANGPHLTILRIFRKVWVMTPQPYNKNVIDDVITTVPVQFAQFAELFNHCIPSECWQAS